MAKSSVKQVQGETPKVPEEIRIPKLNIARAKVRIRGITPLITHNWSEKARKEIRDKQQGNPRLKKAAKDPEAEFNGARYVVDGVDCFPASALKKAIMTAAQFADQYKTVMGMSLFVRGNRGGGMFVEIIGPAPVMREDMVRVGGISKTADMRYRPEYSIWEAEFIVEYNQNSISPGELLNLISIAGFSVGLCEWRPQKGGGDFGRFELATDEEHSS